MSVVVVLVVGQRQVRRPLVEAGRRPALVRGTVAISADCVPSVHAGVIQTKLHTLEATRFRLLKFTVISKTKVLKYIVFRGL